MDEETGYVELVHDLEKKTCCYYDVFHILTYILVVVSFSLLIVLFALFIHRYYTVT